MANEHEGHRKRLKERFRSEGLDSFESHNVLELLLFYANPRSDTNVTAHKLMERFGSLDEVFDAAFEELCEVDGVGENAATLLMMVPQLARRYVTEKAALKNSADGSTDVGAYVLPRFLGLTEEKLMLVSLNNMGRIIACNVVAEGSIDSVSVSVRKIVETALRTKANKVIIAHNHPHGFAVPSEEDISMTISIKKALATVGIELVDHLIVAHDDYVSMLDSGILG